MNKPTELYEREGKFYRVWRTDKGLHSDKIYDDGTLSPGFDVVDSLPTGNWRKLEPAISLDEAIATFTKWLAEHHPDVKNEVTLKASEVFGKVAPAAGRENALSQIGLAWQRLAGFATCDAGPSGYKITIKYPTLEKAQDAYSALHDIGKALTFEPGPAAPSNATAVDLERGCKSCVDQIAGLKGIIARQDEEIKDLKDRNRIGGEFQELAEQLGAEIQEGYKYLRSLFASYAPQCTPMGSLNGLISQIDNCMAGMRDRLLAVAPPPEVIEGKGQALTFEPGPAAPSNATAVDLELQSVVESYERQGERLAEICNRRLTQHIAPKGKRLVRIGDLPEPPRVTFQPPPKPELVLVRYKDREDCYAFLAAESQSYRTATGRLLRASECEVIDETTGEPITQTAAYRC